MMALATQDPDDPRLARRPPRLRVTISVTSDARTRYENSPAVGQCWDLSQKRTPGLTLTRQMRST